MLIGVPRETFSGERRVALVPAHLASLKKSGFEVILEAGAGQAAGFRDEEYIERGATVGADRDEVFRRADVIVQVRLGGANPEAGRVDLDRLRKGQILVGFCDPFSDPAAVRELAGRGVTVFSMELIPRVTRAQSMDALSSAASLAGYRAVLLAAELLPKIFPMMMTAAGTLTPAKVFVVGAGVAGLQAIATAKRLGAVVSGYDVRPVVREQVESLGARFVDLGIETENAEAKGGYAREQSEDEIVRQREAMGRVVAESDVVITTAAIPGRKAPILITADMVRGMAPGSVVVDIAAERGGNCELTSPGETVVVGGVTIAGPTNVASGVAHHGSLTYSKNVTSFLTHLLKNGDGNLDREDPITAETLVARDGEICNARIREVLDGRK